MFPDLVTNIHYKGQRSINTPVKTNQCTSLNCKCFLLSRIATWHIRYTGQQIRMQPAYSLASWGRIDTPISRREDSISKNMLWQILYESTKNVKVMYLCLYIEDGLKTLDEKFFKWHLAVREKTKMIENISLIFEHVDSERRKKMQPRILSMIHQVCLKKIELLWTWTCFKLKINRANSIPSPS
jgi:hypothetical protein